ncbi:4'-phosphopantetheinyl transferase superfamily protein [uncultured Pseudoalteromonas sp.]|uniref:4'-phosphopantetheinyl transferase family protein n=1 Tax=uncultured Pseudoalteromonas sp. TaxID=114053 RepID=UPI0025936A00|nr:4'-phosphopantetheinyl transferase superfamily protein [uncultured Pseudoalteromonas sp.]
MSVTYFENQLEITPALANNSHCIALLNATTLNVGEFDLPHYLSPFELNVINRRKNPQAKQEYLATRLVLKYLVKTACSSYASLKLCDISSEFNPDNSKLELHIKNTTGVISCCISHSHGFVGAALNVASTQFGFDIEKISLKRPFNKLAKHFYHPAEVSLITDTDNITTQAHHFFRIWTLKEALAKATSRPIAQLLSPNVFNELNNTQLTACSNTVVGAHNDMFDISVVAKKSTDWRCSFISLKALSSKLAFK